MRGKPLVIAIDGPAAAGKGTLARRVAEALDFAHLDTGLLYRAIGFAVLRAGKNPMDEAAVLATVTGPDALHLDDPALRQDDVADAAAKVATLPGVRKRLLQFQRDFAAAPPGGKKGAVVEGRDIGTAVLPDANLKIFLTAALEIRAERRLKELRERGLQSIRSQLLREMRE
ncbi:MAG: (d)CMP kinase, partial [Alphaproteobacteria bacterium]